MQVVIARSIEAFGREEWNRLFPGDLEDWSYYRAIEASALPDFELLYLALRENGALRVAVPAFITDYRLDTTLTGPLRRVTNAISRLFPRLLRQRLLCLGSPVGEICHLGFAPDCGGAEQSRLLPQLVGHLRPHLRVIAHSEIIAGRGVAQVSGRPVPDLNIQWD